MSKEAFNCAEESLHPASSVNNSLCVSKEGHPQPSLRVRCEKGNEKLSTGLGGAL